MRYEMLMAEKEEKVDRLRLEVADRDMEVRNGDEEQ